MYFIMYTFIFITIHINVYNIPTFNRKTSTKRSRELSNIDDDDDIPLKDLVKQRSQSSSKYISQSSSKSIPPVKNIYTFTLICTFQICICIHLCIYVYI